MSVLANFSFQCETALTYSSFLGYEALITGLLYLFYKVGFFKFLIDCITKKIFLFCVKTKIESPTHVVTYRCYTSLVGITHH